MLKLFWRIKFTIENQANQIPPRFWKYYSFWLLLLFTFSMTVVAWLTVAGEPIKDKLILTCSVALFSPLYGWLFWKGFYFKGWVLKKRMRKRQLVDGEVFYAENPEKSLPLCHAVSLLSVIVFIPVASLLFPSNNETWIVAWLATCPLLYANASRSVFDEWYDSTERAIVLNSNGILFFSLIKNSEDSLVSFNKISSIIAKTAYEELKLIGIFTEEGNSYFEIQHYEGITKVLKLLETEVPQEKIQYVSYT